MFTYETADQKEVRRFRIAQFNGRMATVKAGESTVTGFVRSVLEQEFDDPAALDHHDHPECAEGRAEGAAAQLARAPLRRRLFLSASTAPATQRHGGADDGFNRSNAAAPRGRGPRCCARRACASLRPDGSRRCAG